MDVASEPIKVQIALQGGGAKICALMAAMEAFQDAEKQGTIRVTRIAATSAGSIVGALFAAGIELGKLREKAREAGLKKVEEAFPDIDGFWSICKAAVASVRGKPIWQEKKLRDLLDRLLTTKGIKTFGDLEEKKGVKLFVIASDVTHSQKVVYNDAGDLLVGSLLDSCGLPFFYRCAAVGGGRVIVDGGLCENFPADELGEEKEYGDILGISLDSPNSGTNPSNFMQFTVSLLNTAINNSVLRAQSRLGNRLLRLQTKIDTFDFKGAVTNGFDSDYDDAKNDTVKFLRRFIDSYKQMANVIAPEPVIDGRVEASVSHVELRDVEVFHGRDWEEQSVEFMMNVYNIYFSQHARQKFHYDTATFEIIANSTLAKDEAGYGALDVITNTSRFRPLPGQPLYCHAMSLYSTGVDNSPLLDSSVLNERWWVCADPEVSPSTRQPCPRSIPMTASSDGLCFFSHLPLPTRETTRCIR